MTTKLLDRICVATDFAAASVAPLSVAASLARVYGASIDLVSVIPPAPLYSRLIAPLRGADTAVATEQVNERLQICAGEPPLSGLSVNWQSRTGVPFAEIIAHARECGDELILVGTRSVGGLQGLLLGSTAERVVRKAPIPVLVAKRGLAQEPSCIVAATDFSDASLPAVRQAADLARQWGARLVLVHAIEPAAEVYGWGAELAGGEVYLVEPEALDPEWAALIGEVDLGNLRWSQHTRRGYAVQVLCEVAIEEHADLLVVGTHGRSALPHVLLGSVAEGVVRQAECNVLTVRPDAFTFRLP